MFYQGEIMLSYEILQMVPRKILGKDSEGKLILGKERVGNNIWVCSTWILLTRGRGASPVAQQ